MSIVWLASYPRSGNTWLRFLIHECVYGPVESSTQVAERIPDIHRTPLSPSPDTRTFAKTHFMLTGKHPHRDQTERAIHVRRHPADVLLSAINYARLIGTSDVETRDQKRAFAKTFIRFGGSPDWIKSSYGTWEQHASTWNKAPFPVLCLTYEELKSDTAAQLRRIMEFLEHPIEEQRLAAAIERSNFDSMQKLEVSEKQAGEASLFRGGAESLQQGSLFVNKGQTGRNLAELGDDIAEMFNRRFAQPLAQYGYSAQSS